MLTRNIKRMSCSRDPSGEVVNQVRPMSLTMPRFYMYSGPAFPSPATLMACRGLQRLDPLNEPMAQFYAELGLHELLSRHPSRVQDPSQADFYYVPVLPHLDQDAGHCNGTGHKSRMQQVATALQASPAWQRHNGSDHVWTCSCVMMKSMLTNSLWDLLGSAVHAVHSTPRRRASPAGCQVVVPYYNPTFARVPGEIRTPGLSRPTLAHFRGRVMNRVRSVLVKRYGETPNFLVAAAHPSTAARCNLNKCKRKAMDKVRSRGWGLVARHLTRAPAVGCGVAAQHALRPVYASVRCCSCRCGGCCSLRSTCLPP